MVPRASAALTRISFRRDVRLFLGALVGYFALLVLFLLLLLQSFTIRTRTALLEQWNAIADEVRQEIDETPPVDPGSLRARLAFLQGRHGLTGIELAGRGGATLRSGSPSPDSLTRTTAAGEVRLFFDAGALRALETTFRRTAIIALAGTVGGIVLLFLYLPRITAPVEEMLEHARELGERADDLDEDRYLIETFKSSIATLKAQEAELKRLHDMQKSRADDLERVTETLTRSLTSGFIAIDARGALVDVNAAAKEILDLPAAENYGGKTPREALGDRPFTRRLEEALEHHSALNRVELAEPDGRVIGLSTVPLVRESGDFLGLLAIFTDLTPIRALEERVRQLQTLADLGEMSAGIAHEFRNSLSTIVGYLRLAERQKEPEEMAGRIRKAEAEANALAAAVDRLLHFARPIAVERQLVNLTGLARDAASAVATGSDGIEITTTGEEVEIEGDPALLHRAIENIVRNAADAVRDAQRPGRITISVERAPVPRLTVTDDGIGMSADDIARAFVPFHSTKPSGFGLGLPLARKIILLHGGDITIRSRRGEGTAVTIELPQGPAVPPAS
ncbi:MAG TPA: ATP-binding protein [Thermoanaerobaculia bacterium]|nr:ATP-binding protein [Thermoanaerobaculia bacterium]